MASSEFYRKFAIYGAGVFFTVTGMAQPFFTLYAQELGASMATIGVLVTLRSLLPIFIAMPVGQLIDLIGSLKMLKIGAICLILSLFINMTATGLFMLALSQLFMGACIIIMSSSLQVMVSEGSKNERNENIKKYSMWMSGGGMMGPLLGGAITSLFATKLIGYKASFAFACIVSVLFLIVLFVISKGYQRPSDKNVSEAKELLKVKGIVNSYLSGVHLTKSRSVQFGLIGTFLIMYIQVLYSSFMPIYLDEMGYTTLLISLIISIQGLAGMASRFALGWIMKRTHLERILLVAGFIASVCLILTPIAALNAVGIITLSLVMGCAVGINLPVSMMIMVNDTKDTDRGKLMGLRLLMNRFSQIISPAMFGVLGQSLGLSAAFLTGGAFLVATLLGFSVYSSMKWGLRTEGIEKSVS